MKDRNEISPNTVQFPSCPGKLEVPTPEEREALSAMRSIKERVRVLKKRLTALNGSIRNDNAGEISDIEQELARLKKDWNKWEKRRQKAARERMIYLGHEESH